MTPANPNPSDALTREILAGAQREYDELIRRARQESDSLLTAAIAEAERIRREKREWAHAEAMRQKEIILATVPVEAGQLRSQRIETLLEGIRAAARSRLSGVNFDLQETIVGLAVNAICQMPEKDFVVKISATDHSVPGEKLAEEIRRRAGRPSLNVLVCACPTMIGGGAVVEDSAGKRVWDNRLLPRLERLWPELRRQIAARASLVGNHEPDGGAA